MTRTGFHGPQARLARHFVDDAEERRLVGLRVLERAVDGVVVSRGVALVEHHEAVVDALAQAVIVRLGALQQLIDVPGPVAHAFSSAGSASPCATKLTPPSTSMSVSRNRFIARHLDCERLRSRLPFA